MAVLYVTDNPGSWDGVLRLLTAAEIDGNFYTLETRVAAVELNLPLPKEIETFSLVGTQLTITMEGGATFGPYTVPVATFHYRGAWAPESAYLELDLVSSPDGLGGLWLVMQGHSTAGVASFDPSALEGGLPLYEQLLPTITEITTRPYDVPFKIGTTPPAAGETIGVIPVPTTRPLRFAANFAGAVGWVGTPPAADYVVEVKDDGLTIGTVTVGAGGSSTFATVGGTTKNVVGGSILTFVAPASPDGSIANGVWTLPAELTL